MPSALASEGRSARSSKARPSTRAERGIRSQRTSAPGQIRWDRVGRVAMLLVGVALAYLYLSAGIHMLSTWSQSRHDSATVAAMEREHTSLSHEHEVLGRQGTLEGEARRLGMMKRGEQPYIVSGLPNN